MTREQVPCGADTHGFPDPGPEEWQFWAFFSLAATVLFAGIVGAPFWGNL